MTDVVEKDFKRTFIKVFEELRKMQKKAKKTM